MHMQKRIRKLSTVKDLVKAGRTRRKLTQVQAAQWFACTDKTIKNWERGRKPLTFWQGPIAEFAGVSIDRVKSLWGNK